ncbi:hypothetical protein CPCC7001_414 [Cyanobium sp. PCC 7001]|nr:hypothetical protein CPCC7001_414 [Cyanobium sp. PCC 7001]
MATLCSPLRVGPLELPNHIWRDPGIHNQAQVGA